MNLGMPRPQAERTLIGAAGEHFVMAELLRRGYIAALAPGGLDEYDILVMKPPVQIQVKSRTRSGDGGWTMTPKHESLTRPGLWYVFVDFELAPAATVATVIRRSHEEYLKARVGTGNRTTTTPGCDVYAMLTKCRCPRRRMGGCGLTGTSGTDCPRIQSEWPAPPCRRGSWLRAARQGQAATRSASRSLTRRPQPGVRRLRGERPRNMRGMAGGRESATGRIRRGQSEVGRSSIPGLENRRFGVGGRALLRSSSRVIVQAVAGESRTGPLRGRLRRSLTRRPRPGSGRQ